MAQQPEGFHELKTGDAAPAFSLPGTDGKTWTLNDLKADVLIKSLDPEWKGPQPHTLLLKVLDTMTEVYQPE